MKKELSDPQKVLIRLSIWICFFVAFVKGVRTVPDLGRILFESRLFSPGRPGFDNLFLSAIILIFVLNRTLFRYKSRNPVLFHLPWESSKPAEPSDESFSAWTFQLLQICALTVLGFAAFLVAASLLMRSNEPLLIPVGVLAAAICLACIFRVAKLFAQL